MSYIKLINNIVVQKQPNPQEGFIYAPDSVVCGMVWDGVDYIAPVTIKIVNSVTMRQARLALLQTGNLANVTSAIAAMTGIEGDAARIVWEFSNTVERNNPLITQLGTALNLTSAQLDDLFTLAATL